MSNMTVAQQNKINFLVEERAYVVEYEDKPLGPGKYILIRCENWLVGIKTYYLNMNGALIRTHNRDQSPLQSTTTQLSQYQTDKIGELVGKGYLPIFTVPGANKILEVTLEHSDKDDIKVLINQYGRLFYHPDMPLPLPSI